GHQSEPGRHPGDLVAVAHPDVEQAMAFGVAVVLDALEQPGMAAGPHPGVAELAHRPGFDRATQLGGHGLHAVADTEHRYAELEHPLRCPRPVGLVHRLVAAGEHDAAQAAIGGPGFERRVGSIPGMDLAVDLALANPS